jgi:hypothetical protein
MVWNILESNQLADVFNGWAFIVIFMCVQGTSMVNDTAQDSVFFKTIIQNGKCMLRLNHEENEDATSKCIHATSKS